MCGMWTVGCGWVLETRDASVYSGGDAGGVEAEGVVEGDDAEEEDVG